MIIETVHLRNFRSHKDTKLDFGRGTTVIIGENGAGKTSILEAISFALFKEKPDGVGVDELIRLSAAEGEVSLTFHANGRRYLVRRKRTHKRGAESYFYRLGSEVETLLVKGEREVTSEVEATLGINGELYTSAVYIKQGEIDKLLAGDPATRKKHVGKLIGAEDMENAHKNFLDVIRIYDSRIQAYSMVPAELDEKRAALDREKKEIKALRSELSKIEGMILEKRAGLEAVEAGLAGLEELLKGSKELEKLSLERSYLEKEIEMIQSYERQLQETEEGSLRAGEIEKEMRELRRETASYEVAGDRCKRAKLECKRERERLGSLKKDVEKILSNAAKMLGTSIGDASQLQGVLERAVAETKKALEVARNEKEKATGLLGEKNAALSAVRKAVLELEGSVGSCPVCGRELSDAHKEELNSRFNSEIQGLSEEIDRLVSAIKGMKKQTLELEGKMDSFMAISPEAVLEKTKAIMELEKRIAELEKGVKEDETVLKGLPPLMERLKGLEREFASLKLVWERHTEARQFLRKNLSQKERLAEKIRVLRKEVAHRQLLIDRKREEIGVDGGGLEDLLVEKREVHKRVREELGAVEKEKASLGSSIGWKEKRLSELREEIVKREEQAGELKGLIKFKALLEKMRALFHKDRLQRELRLKARPLIEEYTREVFSRFNLPYSDVTITDDFSLRVHGEHGEESIDMLSGGERMAAALALRVGLSRALSGQVMELIILDEPTIHLDSQRRRELVDIVKRLATIPQTIVVTHDKEFEEAADRIIEVEKIDGVSVVR